MNEIAFRAGKGLSAASGVFHFEVLYDAVYYSNRLALTNTLNVIGYQIFLYWI